MTYWWTVFEGYREMCFAASLALQESIDLITKYRFKEAEQVKKAFGGYQDCCLAALKLLEGA